MSASFWVKVKTGSADECWPWMFGIDSRGYGHLQFNGGPMRAHRVAYQLAKGEIPKGEGHHGTVVMHMCDNKLCCNPEHLRLGSHADNMADMKAKGRRAGIGTGAHNGRAKLTLEQARAIKADKRGKRTIAKQFDVSPAQVQRIRLGKQWVAA